MISELAVGAAEATPPANAVLASRGAASQGRRPVHGIRHYQHQRYPKSRSGGPRQGTRIHPVCMRSDIGTMKDLLQNLGKHKAELVERYKRYSGGREANAETVPGFEGKLRQESPFCPKCTALHTTAQKADELERWGAQPEEAAAKDAAVGYTRPAPGAEYGGRSSEYRSSSLSGHRGQGVSSNRDRRLMEKDRLEKNRKGKENPGKGETDRRTCSSTNRAPAPILEFWPADPDYGKVWPALWRSA
ncbi:hypothetical protein K438DRAFT_2058137 [Mycena galopus ATCC 62051]|nr:hypothetical protein K438DRAFT_2058137 [Mycena galopus ATCC 62051]